MRATLYFAVPEDMIVPYAAQTTEANHAFCQESATGATGSGTASFGGVSEGALKFRAVVRRFLLGSQTASASHTVRCSDATSKATMKRVGRGANLFLLDGDRRIAKFDEILFLQFEQLLADLLGHSCFQACALPSEHCAGSRRVAPLSAEDDEA